MGFCVLILMAPLFLDTVKAQSYGVKNGDSWAYYAEQDSEWLFIHVTVTKLPLGTVKVCGSDTSTETKRDVSLAGYILDLGTVQTLVATKGSGTATYGNRTITVVPWQVQVFNFWVDVETGIVVEYVAAVPDGSFTMELVSWTGEDDRCESGLSREALIAIIVTVMVISLVVVIAIVRARKKRKSLGNYLNDDF